MALGHISTGAEFVGSMLFQNNLLIGGSLGSFKGPYANMLEATRNRPQAWPVLNDPIGERMKVDERVLPEPKG